MDLLFYKRGRTGKTGRVLARNLGILSTNGDLNHSIGSAKTLIRWGNSASLPNLALIEKELNSSEAIKLAGDKRQSLVKLSESGLNVPKFKLDGVGPALGRRINHQGGLDIKIFSSGETLEGRDYYLEIIPSDKEYRVHCLVGKVIAIQKKVLKVCNCGNDPKLNHSPTDSCEVARPPEIRNHSKGWRFEHMTLKHLRLQNLGLSAVECLGLNFGAVDILRGLDGKYYILEVNTAPGLEKTTLERYAKGFREVLGE